MSQTLGDLVDKLVTTSLKLWFTQDKVYEAARRSEDLKAPYVQQLASLNLLRNQLMTEIDQTINQAIKDGGAAVDARVKITE